MAASLAAALQLPVAVWPVEALQPRQVLALHQLLALVLQLQPRQPVEQLLQLAVLRLA